MWDLFCFLVFLFGAIFKYCFLLIWRYLFIINFLSLLITIRAPILTYLIIWSINLYSISFISGNFLSLFLSICYLFIFWVQNFWSTFKFYVLSYLILIFYCIFFLIYILFRTCLILWLVEEVSWYNALDYRSWLVIIAFSFLWHLRSK